MAIGAAFLVTDKEVEELRNYTAIISGSITLPCEIRRIRKQIGQFRLVGADVQ